jgi:S-(hydroxymethyl)glutathione dehydrogenase/alcohol dehydrogenase
MHDGTARVHRNGEDLSALGRIGSFAEQVVVPAEQVIPIRSDVPMDVLALIGCAVTTGVGAVINAAKVEPGSSVAVIGCGGVGLNVIQGAGLVGASRIIAVDLLDNKLEYARQFGATDTVSARTGDPVEQVRALTGGGVDYAFEVIGNGRTVEQAIEMTRVGGTACIVGMAPQGSRSNFDPLLFVNKETKLIGTWYGSARPRIDFPRMVELTLAGKLKVTELISRRYTLERACPWAAGAEIMLRSDGAWKDEALQLTGWSRCAHRLDPVGGDRVRPVVGSIHQLEQGADALRTIEGRRATGKVVIAVG